jgi:DNA-binding response OmpR family regulator
MTHYDAGKSSMIILLSAVFTETPDVLRGFKAGADDYVLFPRDLREILARVRANLPPEVVDIEDYIRIDFDRRRLWINRGQLWQKEHLPPLQFELLRVLILNAGLIMTSATLTELVFFKEVSDGALAVTIFRLRQKVEPDPSHPRYIEAIRGIGYRFNGSPSRARPPGDINSHLTDMSRNDSH